MARSVIVAVSGPDNVGKSTQLRLLRRRLGPVAINAGALHDHDRRWDGIRAAGMASWWFDTSSIEEFVDVLACSYVSRLHHAQEQTGALVLIDRGLPMLEATVAATLATRLHLDDEKAASEAVRLLGPYRDDLSRVETAEAGILLLHTTDPQSSATASLAREPHTDEVYRRYQQHLAYQVLRVAGGDRFARTIIVGDRPIMAVQSDVRTAAATWWPMPRCRIQEVATVALGGMSESGKSAVGATLHRRHGFARLKIGYLIDEAANRHGIDDPYALAETTQAELLVDSLDRYIAGNRFVDRVSLESLHRFGVTRALQTLLGPALTVAYIDTPTELRQQRGEHGPGDTIERDLTKTARGAEHIRQLADVVIDNGRSHLHLRRQVDTLAYRSGACLKRPWTRPVDTLDLPTALCDPLSAFVDDLTAAEGVDLIAVTGSGGRGKYQHGWSDLDILVLADPGMLDRVQRAAATLRAAVAPVKIGLTVATINECHAVALTPRLVHVLRDLGTGALGAQHVRDGLRLPVPSVADDAEASLADGALTAIEIRRLLIGGCGDTRALYKLAALLAKVMLRQDGAAPADDATALAGLAIVDPDLLRAARTDPDTCRRLATMILDAWLATIPSRP